MNIKKVTMDIWSDSKTFFTTKELVTIPHSFQGGKSPIHVVIWGGSRGQTILSESLN